MALLAPLISDKAGLSAVASIDNPTWAPPSRDFPLGTDNLGRSVAAQFVWGSRISLFVGLMATVLTIAIGSVVGIMAGFFGGWTDVGADAHHRLVPRHPVPAAGDRARGGARALGLEHHPRDRDHVVAGDGARSCGRRC